MKTPTIILGSLGLQTTFHFPHRKTHYRTIMPPSRPANLSYGGRACLNLRTNKAVTLQCRESVIVIITWIFRSFWK